MSRSVPDWSGGTRIGGAIREFHQRWGRRVLNGGPVVLLISDGWDRGDPEELRVQIARLQRRCHRLVWLNPLIGTRVRAADTRASGGAAVCRRFPAVAHADQSRGSRAHLNTLRHGAKAGHYRNGSV